MKQREMMPAILGMLLHTDEVLNIGDVSRRTRFGHDKVVGCVKKLLSMGLVETIPSGLGFHSITVVMPSPTLISQDND